ncbi:MAG: hypothetical protein JO041_16010 [Acidobacteria bacterium]|nr:hypothetical protein [Acidobacteriota bacterium]
MKPGIRYFTAAAVFALCAAGAAGAQKAPRGQAPPADTVELSADPAFRLTFTSDRVQVYRLDLGPQAATQLDRHDRDYLVVSLTSSRLQATDGTHTNNLALEPEALQVMKGGWPHRIANQGDTAAAAVIIIPAAKLDPEHAMCGLAARQCRGGEIGDELGKYTESILFDTPTAKLTQAEIAPGAQIPPTDYVNPVLIIATTEIHFTDRRSLTDSQDEGKELDLQLKPGDTAYIPGGTTEIMKNAGKDDARFVLLTLRPAE